MATTAKIQAVTTPATVDFDTRLTLASAGMDAILAHKHGVTLAEAQTAVREAQEASELLAEPVRQFTPHPILAAAGRLIRRRGWTQDEFQSPSGALCALGAIRVAVYGDRDEVDSVIDVRENEAVCELTRRIAAQDGLNAHSITMWNDSRTSADEVLKLLY